MTGVAVCALMVSCAEVCAQQPQLLQRIILRSGDAPVGTNDPQVTMLPGPLNAPFGSPFTPTDFAAASNGPAPVVIQANPAYFSSLPSDPAAQWIATCGPPGANPSCAASSDPGSALFAVDFVVTAPISSATLTLDFGADNTVGSAIAPGVYLNGLPLSGSTFAPATCGAPGCGFSSPHSIVRTDVGPLIQAATNSLYIYLADQGSAAALIFSATIDILGPGSPAPYPGTNEDYRLQSAVFNGAPVPVDLVPIKSANPLDTVVVTLESPNMTYQGCPFSFLGQLWPGSSSGMPVNVPGAAWRAAGIQLWVDFTFSSSVVAFADALSPGLVPLVMPGGNTFAFVVPPGLAGQSIMLQGGAVTMLPGLCPPGAPTPQNTVAALTDAHEIQFL